MNLRSIELSTSFGDVDVLRRISLDVERGESVALIGPNGSGKSTLLMTLAGLLNPSEGSVEVDGKPMVTLSRRDAVDHVAFLPQVASYAFSMTVLSFVTLGFHTELSRFGRLNDGQRERLAAALERFAMTDFSARMLHELSGGELQRARLARIATSRAPFVLLDEPTAPLDPKYATMTVDWVVGETDRDRGVIVSLHDFSLLDRFDRFVLLNHGEIAAEGPTDALPVDEVASVYDVAIERLEKDGRIAWVFG